MKKFVLLLLIILLSNCGFKVVTKDDFGDYKVKEILTTGDSRISFDLKKKVINNSSEYSQNLIRVNMNVKKTKEIKEKNIQNEITKYTIKLSASSKIEEINQDKNFNITESVSADYNVEDQFIKTRNNEKKIIKSLTNNLSDQIINSIKSELHAN
tara:strand:+ start:474 stop:938 length:465 start_codon:yes stop_codon:yes gene_type:complete